MGTIVKMFTGGSGSKQSSGNSAFEQLKGLLSGNIGQGNNAMSTMSALLGIGGDKAAGDKAFNNYLDSSGFQSMVDTGSKAITGNMASKGLMNSGATVKAQTKFGNELGRQKFGDYLAQLGGLGSYGLDSSKVLAGAGQVSSGKSSSYGGIINSLFG